MNTDESIEDRNGCQEIQYAYAVCRRQAEKAPAVCASVPGEEGDYYSVRDENLARLRGGVDQQSRSLLVEGYQARNENLARLRGQGDPSPNFNASYEDALRRRDDNLTRIRFDEGPGQPQQANSKIRNQRLRDLSGGRDQALGFDVDGKLLGSVNGFHQLDPDDFSHVFNLCQTGKVAWSAGYDCVKLLCFRASLQQRARIDQLRCVLRPTLARAQRPARLVAVTDAAIKRSCGILGVDLDEVLGNLVPSSGRTFLSGVLQDGIRNSYDGLFFNSAEMLVTRQFRETGKNSGMYLRVKCADSARAKSSQRLYLRLHDDLTAAALDVSPVDRNGMAFLMSPRYLQAEQLFSKPQLPF